MDRSDESLAGKLQALLPHLDERQRRLLLGAEARVLGHGGIRRVARAAGVAEGTVSRGVIDATLLVIWVRPDGVRLFGRLSDSVANGLPVPAAVVVIDYCAEVRLPDLPG